MGSSTELGCGSTVARRSFLKGSTATIAVAAMGPMVLIADVARAKGDAPTRSYFDDRVGSFFSIDDGAWQSVELTGVTSNDASGLLDQFTVMFRGSLHVPIEEGLYTVAPPDGASFDLYIQPAGEDRYGCDYKAVFSVIRRIGRRRSARR